MVLEGTDFSKVEIDVILVETNRRGIEAINKNDVMDWFATRGTKCKNQDRMLFSEYDCLFSCLFDRSGFLCVWLVACLACSGPSRLHV